MIDIKLKLGYNNDITCECERRLNMSSQEYKSDMDCIVGVGALLGGAALIAICVNNNHESAKKTEAQQIQEFKAQGFTNVVKEIGGLGVNYGDCKLTFKKEEEDSYTFQRFDTKQSEIPNVSFQALGNAPELSGCVD